MIFRCRANELIVRDVETLPHRGESSRDFVDELLRCFTTILRFERDLLPVLVHADEKVHVVAGEAAVTRNRIGTDLLERVPVMRIAVRIVDCSRDVESSHLALAGIPAPAPSAP